MKKRFFVFAIAILCSAAGHTQSPVKYADLVVYRKFLKNYIAELHTENSNRKRTLLKNNNGNKMLFTTTIDALNYTCGQGWQLVSAYSQRGGETHFILKK